MRPASFHIFVSPVLRHINVEVFDYLCCMGRNEPVVSVLMPAYNHGKYIRQAIESFLDQQEIDARLYIGDDASTDNTLSIAREYADKFPDKITIFAHQRNLGLMGNYKFLIENSASTYIAILESDDYWTYPLKLHKQVEYMESHPGCGLVYTSCEFVQEQGKQLGIKCVKDKLYISGSNSGERLVDKVMWKNPVVAVTACFRRSAFDASCILDDFIKEDFVTFDYPVWLGLASCSDFYSLSDITAAYRVMGSSVSNSANYAKREHFMSGIDRIVEYSVDRFSYGGDIVALRNERVVKHMMLALAFSEFERYSYFCKQIYPWAGLKWAVIRYIPWIFRFKKRKIIGTRALDKLAVL